MAEMGKHVRSFGINILSNLGASIVISLGAAIWLLIRHGSVDWIGIACLFLLTGVVFFFLIRAVHRTPKESIEVQQEIATDPCDGLFTALQMESFQLSKELGELLKDAPPAINHWSMSAKELENLITNERIPWRRRITATYDLEFASRVKQVFLKYRQADIYTPSLAPFIEHVTSENEIKQVQLYLVMLAHQQDGLDLVAKT